jgi:hexosaminidase
MIAVALACAAQDQPVTLHLLPVPAKVVTDEGRLSIDESFSVAVTGVSDPRITSAVKRLIPRLTKQTGIPLVPALPASPAQATLLIRCDHAGAPVQKLGENESYKLELTETQARLTAPNPLGILRGLETFVQLIEPSSGGFSAPVVTIDDQPRFPWRGLHLDVSRHWMPTEVVLRNLDGMAAVKLNVFHWHLSDDQGFRIESKLYPKLQERGADGHYYTQDQVRQVIAYARDRGIRVVPEFDVPAHAIAWLVGYPELAPAPGPYEIGRHWGIFEPAMDPSKETVYTFLDGFIGEMSKLFPDEYFHIGGDEVNGKQWNESPRIQAFKKAQGFADNHALQAYFNRRLQAIVKKHGKHMEGWDEVLDPDLSKDIVIQSWRGQKSLAEAARLGYSGLLSAPYYLDHMKTAADMYLSDPLENESADLTPEEQKRILGGEIATWSEFLTPENIDSRIWPRAAAIAERFWSPQTVKDVPSMYERSAILSRELEDLGLLHQANYRTMLERIAGPHALEPLSTLASVVSPVKLGTRARARQYTQQTPLNRLCDAAQPESTTARQFQRTVEAMLAGEGGRDSIRLQLLLWRENESKLRPEFDGNLLMHELAPVSANVSALASTGLAALDAIDAHKRPTDAWIGDQRALLENSRKPQAELIIQIVPAIQKLVDAAAAL